MKKWILPILAVCAFTPAHADDHSALYALIDKLPMIQQIVEKALATDNSLKAKLAGDTLCGTHSYKIALPNVAGDYECTLNYDADHPEKNVPFVTATYSGTATSGLPRLSRSSAPTGCTKALFTRSLQGLNVKITCNDDAIYINRSGAPVKATRYNLVVAIPQEKPNAPAMYSSTVKLPNPL